MIGAGTLTDLVQFALIYSRMDFCRYGGELGARGGLLSASMGYLEFLDEEG